MQLWGLKMDGVDAVYIIYIILYCCGYRKTTIFINYDWAEVWKLLLKKNEW